MAFELTQFGVGMKIIEPGGMKTDFFTRSFDVGRHADYDVLVRSSDERDYRPERDGRLFDP